MDKHDARSSSTIVAGPHAYTGVCHCGAVRFRAELDLSAGTGRCNCSICQKSSVTSAIAKPSNFDLLSGSDHLGTYEWGGNISRRYFCKDCGIHAFARGHVAELGGDYVSVNVNTLDDVEITEVAVVHWDGRHNNWQAGPRPSPWPVHATSPSADG
jgi:hypothetical protein